MEEKTRKFWEDKNLNSNKKNNIEEVVVVDNWVYTEEEVEDIRRKIRGDSEKGVQKLIWEKKLLEEALEELANIAFESERLVELADEKPSLAKIILEKYFKETLEEYKERINYSEKISNPNYIKTKIEKEAVKKAEAKIYEIELKKFKERLKIQEDENKRFERVLREFKIDINHLDEIFEKAYLISREENIETLEQEEKIWKLMSTTTGKSIWKNFKEKSNTQKEVEEFLKKYKVI